MQNLVADVVSNPDKQIMQLDFVDDEEREKVLNTFNATELELQAPYKDVTIHGLFEHFATKTPDATAISFEVSSRRWHTGDWIGAVSTVIASNMRQRT